MESRTTRAVLVAAAIAFASVAGIAVFLGMPVSGSLIAGLAAAALGGGLIAAASRRAQTFYDTTAPTDEEPRG